MPSQLLRGSAAEATTHLSLALNGTVPSNAIYSSYTAEFTRVGEFALANAFAAAYSNDTAAALTTRVLSNLGVTAATIGATSYATLASAVETAFASFPTARGQVALNLARLLTGLETDATYGAAATAFNNNAAVAFTYSSNVANTTSTTLAALNAPVDRTLTLTTGVDNITGGAGRDTFVALIDTTTLANSTLTSGDSVSGGAGADRLAITITGTGATATYGSGVRADVETLEVTNLGANAHTIDATLMPSLTTLSVVGGSSAVTFSGVQGVDAVNLATSQNVTVTMAAPFGTGTADTAPVTLNGASTSASNTLTYNGIENLNVALSGTPTGSVPAGFSTTIASNTAKSVTLTGDQAAVVVLSTPGATTANDTNTINASATTGAVNLTYTPGAAAKTSVTLGSGNDVLNYSGTVVSTTTLTGGAGTDTLGINAAVGYDSVLGASQGDNVTGFEILRTNATISSQDMRALSKNTITGLEVASGSATLSQSPVLSTLRIGGGGSGASVTLATTANTTNDAIAVTLGDNTLNTPVAAAGGGSVSLTLSDYERISIASIGAANGTVSLTSVALKELTVTGDQNVTVNAGSTSTAVSKIDASAHTGASISVSASGSTVANTITLGGQLNATVTSGTGADVITGAAGNDSISSGDGADSINAGAGNDSIDAGIGNDTVLGGAGNDSITAGDGADSVDGGTGNDTIFGGLGNDTILGGDGNDSIDAGSGDDSVDGGAGNDTITAGTGTDIILGGDGNDTIIFGSSLTTGDSVDGGAGTDTVSATISASATPTFLNVENLNFTGGLATAATSAADPYGTAVNLASSTGATSARVQLTGTNSGGLINAPSTLTNVFVADAGVGSTLNLRWASAPTSATVTVDTLATAGIVTAGASTLTVRQATTLAYDDTASTGRTYAQALNSTVGAITTDARSLTVDMPALTAASQTGGTNLTTGDITANSLESVTVQAGGYATATTGNISSSNADFGSFRVTSGDVSTTTVGNLSAPNASTVAAHFVSAGTAASTTVGSVTYGATTAVTRADFVAGISSTLIHGAVTSGLVSTLNVDVGVNADIRLAQANVTYNGGGNVASNVFDSRVSTATIALASGTTESFSFTNTGAQGSFTLSGASLNTSNVKFAAAASLSSFSASGYSGQLNFDGSAVVGAISSLTGTNRADTLVGGGGNDTISGGVGDDSIVGGAGNDSIDGGAGSDTITGGLGADIINVGTGTDSVLMTATGQSFAGASITSGTTVLTGIDRVSGLGTGDVISLAGILNTFTGAAGTTIASATGTTVAVVRGDFVAATGVFTASSTGADSLLVYDADGAGAGTAVEAVVLVGYTGTGSTAAAGVITLG